jgi:hypothetical protein
MKTWNPNLWPVAIVTLLLSSVLMMMFVLFVAQADGGAQVVENYYSKAVSWDSLQVIRSASNDLNWSASVTFDQSVSKDGAARGVIDIRNQDDDPISGLSGYVRISQPHRSVALSTDSLQEDQNAVGAYSFDLPAGTRGLIDLLIEARKGENVFVSSIRTER